MNWNLRCVKSKAGRRFNYSFDGFEVYNFPNKSHHRTTRECFVTWLFHDKSLQHISLIARRLKTILRINKFSARSWTGSGLWILISYDLWSVRPPLDEQQWISLQMTLQLWRNISNNRSGEGESNSKVKFVNETLLLWINLVNVPLWRIT